MPQQRECVRLKLQLRTMCTASLGDKLERREAKTLELAFLGKDLSLPSLAKNYVLRMLMIEEPVPQGEKIGKEWVDLGTSIFILELSLLWSSRTSWMRAGSVENVQLLLESLEGLLTPPLLFGQEVGDVVDAWIADVRQFGSFHKQALRSLLSLDVYLRGSE
eukprot:1157206-Pelagomonas_calceolata.AAC.1